MTRGTPILFAALLLAPAAAPLAASDGPPDDRKIVIHDGEVTRIDDDDGPLVVKRREHPFRRGYIGVRPIDMTPDLRAHYGAPRNAGVLVGEVEADGPAAKAGLLVGDIVTAVDGQKIESGADLSRAVRPKKGGETVELDVVRDRSKKSLTAVVAERKRAEAAWNDLPHRLKERTFTVPIPDFELRMPGRLDLDRLNERLREIERQIQDLEKRLPAR